MTAPCADRAPLDPRPSTLDRTLRVAALLAVASAVACSSGDDVGDDSVTPTMCGLAASPAGSECVSNRECGAGSSNFTDVEFCSACPSRSDSHVCESGTCREMSLVDVQFQFGVPPATAGAKSYTITSFNPTMADGGTMTCAALLSTCTFLDNDRLNAPNSRFSRFPNESADPAGVIVGAMSFEVGSNRLLFVQAMSERQGNGTVMGKKCIESIEVKASGNDTVFFELEAP